MMMARAQGLVPSIASQQAALDMQRATAAQSSAAASARGAAGLALAGQNAANNTATMQSAISNNAQVNAMNERLAAEQNALGAYSGIRAGDVQSQAQAAQQAQYAAQLGAQQNQFNAGLAQQQHGLNDAYSMGLYGQEANVRQMQLNGGLASQGLLSQSQMNATNQNVAISQNNANREYDYYKQAMGAAQGGLTAGTMMQGTPAPSVQPATGVGAPTSGVGANGSTNMVGVPVPSDDRMKSGITPLGLLGVYGGAGSGPQNPMSGPVGGGGYGAAPSSYEVLSNGGENVAASGDAMSRVATQYQSDPTGGMQSGGLLSDYRAKSGSYGLLSDDRAKREYFELGARYATKHLTGEEMQPWTSEEDVDTPRATPTSFAPAGPHPLPDAPSFAPSGPNPLPPAPRPADRGSRGLATEPLDMGGLLGAAQLGGRGRPEPIAQDPVTEQFATGLAPISFRYKEGMGPSGRQTGVRAQAAASQPLTASMVTRRGDGLLQIDPRMGLSTALAGVGNNAQKQLVLERRQEDQEAKLNGLLAMMAKREGY
jgi:hypothetical protein